MSGGDAVKSGGAGGGGLLSAYGQLLEGYAEESAQNANAQIAEENAQLSLEKAVEDERRLRVLGNKSLADIRTGYAASGITMEGSPLEVLRDSAANVERDALTIRHVGENTARAYRNEAELSRVSGRSARRLGEFGAAATTLTSGAKAAAAGG